MKRVLDGFNQPNDNRDMNMNTKTITNRSYRMLIKKVEIMEFNEQGGKPPSEALKTLKDKMISYSVPCNGDAHSNPFIDNCGCCINYTWGFRPNLELVK